LGKRLFLAPMAGITDWPFRLLCGQMGADETVSEMISAMGLLTAPKGSPAYAALLAVHPGEVPLSAQLFGKEPDLLARAAALLWETGRYAGIDLNFGCPAQKVTSSGSGSALMKDFALSGRILRSVRHAVPGRLSVKMRLGWDEKSVNAVPFARLCEDEGADLLCVHGRTRSKQYGGKADWPAIAAVRQAVSIPLIANGDVFAAQDAVSILEMTGADGVAVGRGALGNPWLFSQIKAAFAGQEAMAPSPDEVRRIALSHLRDMVAFKGESWALVEMRKHFGWYLKGTKGAAQTRALINRCTDLDALTGILDAHFSGCGD